MVNNLREIPGLVKNEPSKKVAVAAAADDEILEVVQEAVSQGLAEFILIGDKSRILAIAEENCRNIGNSQIIDIPDPREAAAEAVRQVRAGNAQAVMKGLLHTGMFMKAVLNKENGLNTGRLVSQVSVFNRPDGDGLIFITDGVVSIEPDLAKKQTILENAVMLAGKFGIECPKVALLSAVETVNPAMPDTMDAAVLSKMNERGQIRGCVVDGPLAMDNILSEEAARHKGIQSEVAGHADIILVPNIQVGNAVIKTITYFAKQEMASILTGAAAPLIVTSRTDTVEGKLLSLAAAIYTS